MDNDHSHYHGSLFYRQFELLFRKFTGRSLSAESYAQLVRHYLISAGTAAANFIVFNAFAYLGLGTTKANAATFIILLTIAFFVRRNFVFRTTRSSVSQPILFVVNLMFYFVLDTALLLIMIDMLHGAPFIGKLVSMILLSPLNFLAQKYVVFKDSGR